MQPDLPKTLRRGIFGASTDGSCLILEYGDENGWAAGLIRTPWLDKKKGLIKLMARIAVIYWSGTGNTEQMAHEVVQGAKDSGAQVDLFGVSEFSSSQCGEYDALAFGCPSMGAEQLEESEFEPVFTECEPYLKGKKLGLFGSYGWGDGEWMRSWEEQCSQLGAQLVKEGVICNGAPDEEGVRMCRELGKALTK